MGMKELLEKVSHLEFVNDQLTAEFQYMDSLLKEVGFTEGLKSVKSAAKEILEQGKVESESEDGKGYY